MLTKRATADISFFSQVFSAISLQFTLEVCVAAENRKNKLQFFILGIRNHPR